MLESFAEFAQFRILLAAPYGHRHAHLIAETQHAIVGVDDYALRLAEGIHGKLRGRAHHVHALFFRVAFGLDLEIHRMRKVSRSCEILPITRKLCGAQNGVLQLELGSQAGFNPWMKK